MTRYLARLGLLTLSLFSAPLGAMMEDGEDAPKSATHSSASIAPKPPVQEEESSAVEDISKVWGVEKGPRFKQDIQKILQPLSQDHRATFVTCVKTLLQDPGFFPNKTLEKVAPLWWGFERILKALVAQPSPLQPEFVRYCLLVNTLLNTDKKMEERTMPEMRLPHFDGYINPTDTIEAMSKLPPERWEWFHKTLGHFLKEGVSPYPGPFPRTTDYSPHIGAISSVLSHLSVDETENFVSQSDSLIALYRNKGAFSRLSQRSNFLCELYWTPPSEREDAVLRVMSILEEDYGLGPSLPADHTFTSDQKGSASYLCGMMYVLGNTPRDQRDDVVPLLRRVIKKESSGKLFGYIHFWSYDQIMEGLRKADRGRVPSEDDDNSETGSYEESEDS